MRREYFAENLIISLAKWLTSNKLGDRVRKFKIVIDHVYGQ